MAVKKHGLVYDIDIRFAIAGLILPAIAMLSLIPMFLGYWKLERRYTGSPVEVAEAFDRDGQFFEKRDGVQLANITDTLDQALPGKVEYTQSEGGGWTMKREEPI